MVLIVFGSKFYALSHAFDGISKFCPVSPKMADTWGLVGCISGVRFRYLGTLRSTALKNWPFVLLLSTSNDFDELFE